jgi:hypothetical protein
MSPLDFISATYDEGGQTKRLFFTPIEGWFGLRSTFNRFTAQWFDAIRAAIATATGRAPGNTPANQLGTPSSSRAVLLALLLPLVAGLLLAAVLIGMALRKPGLPVLEPASPMRDDVAQPPKIPGKPPDSGVKE